MENKQRSNEVHIIWLHIEMISSKMHENREQFAQNIDHSRARAAIANSDSKTKTFVCEQ